MRKLWLSLLLAGCAATSDGLVPPTPVDLISPEADLTAPGMIPAECEALLQKSQSWGYRPGEWWRPQNLEMANEALDFFSRFSQVPENTSNYLNQWAAKANSTNEAEAKVKVSELNRAQVCDFVLTAQLMDGLLKYPWPKAQRAEVGKKVHQFILNQQARRSFMSTRAVTLDVLDSSRKRGFLPSVGGGLERIRKKFDSARGKIASKTPASALEDEELIRFDLKLSDELREDLSRHIPLP